MAIITEITAKNISYLYKRSEQTVKSTSKKTDAYNDKQIQNSNSLKTELPKDELLLSEEATKMVSEQKNIATRESSNSTSSLKTENI